MENNIQKLEGKIDRGFDLIIDRLNMILEESEKTDEKLLSIEKEIQALHEKDSEQDARIDRYRFFWYLFVTWFIALLWVIFYKN